MDPGAEAAGGGGGGGGGGSRIYVGIVAALRQRLHGPSAVGDAVRFSGGGGTGSAEIAAARRSGTFHAPLANGGVTGCLGRRPLWASHRPLGVGTVEVRMRQRLSRLGGRGRGGWGGGGGGGWAVGGGGGGGGGGAAEQGRERGVGREHAWEPNAGAPSCNLADCSALGRASSQTEGGCWIGRAHLWRETARPPCSSIDLGGYVLAQPSNSSRQYPAGTSYQANTEAAWYPRGRWIQDPAGHTEMRGYRNSQVLEFRSSVVGPP